MILHIWKDNKNLSILLQILWIAWFHNQFSLSSRNDFTFESFIPSKITSAQCITQLRVSIFRYWFLTISEIGKFWEFWKKNWKFQKLGKSENFLKNRNPNDSLTSFMNTSASLSSLSLTMVYQQLKLNPSLFSKFYEKIEKVLNAKNSSYRELYITAVSIRESLEIVSNYAELVKSAIKLYSKSLSPEMAPIASLG